MTPLSQQERLIVEQIRALNKQLARTSDPQRAAELARAMAELSKGLAVPA